ncbi:MAG TPA: class I SAM-dependent methyltransferase, partial [Gemmatimonadaceae bacterium]|nr:class I SAM-dependent methyltransferase [Gemmatimonadaceae bacterium]
RRRIVAALIDELLPSGRDRLIIDVGCGTGANVAALGKRRTCVGIDVSPEGIALAREQYAGCEFRVGYAPDDISDLVGSADLFLLMDVLEHVRDDIALFTSIMAAAKPGALALITVPADPALWSQHDVTHMHYRRYTPARLSELWRDDALEPLLMTGLNFRLLPVVRTVRSIERKRGRAIGPGDTDLAMPPGPINGVLTSIFAGEKSTLVSRLRENRIDPAPSGVSMLAIVRRSESLVNVRTRDHALAAQDLNDPEQT